MGKRCIDRERAKGKETQNKREGLKSRGRYAEETEKLMKKSKSERQKERQR